MEELTFERLVELKNSNKIKRAFGYLSRNGNFTVRDFEGNRYCISNVGVDWIEGFFRVYRGNDEVFIKQSFDVKHRQLLGIMGLLLVILLFLGLDVLIDTNTNPQNIIKAKITEIEQFRNSLKSIDEFVLQQKKDILDNEKTLEEMKRELEETKLTLDQEKPVLQAFIASLQRNYEAKKRKERTISFLLGIMSSLCAALIIKYSKYGSIKRSFFRGV